MIPFEDLEDFRQELLEEARRDAEYEYRMDDYDDPLWVDTVKDDSDILTALACVKAWCKRYDRDFKEEIEHFMDEV